MHTSPDKRLKIAYITTTDAEDKHAWSGTHHYIWKTVEKNCGEVTLLGPVNPFITIFLCKIVHGISLFFFKKRFNYRDSIILAKAYGRIFSRKLKQGTYDLIIAPAGSTNIAYLKTNVPIVYIADRTIQSTLNYHQMLTNLLDFSRRQSIFIDKKAIEKASLAIYSSKWAATSAIEDYHINPEKVVVVPFGANLDKIPLRAVAVSRKKTSVCRLLFIGVSWENKGGAIAFDALLSLLQSGVDTTLTVCGCVPPTSMQHPSMKIIPFLNKNDGQQKKELEQLFISNDFLILPTRFDCTPIVFCEAGAYGLPCIAPETGGIASVITNGVNGFLVPYDAAGSVYASKIKKVFEDENAYNSLIISSRDNFERQLNWDSWAVALNKLIKEKIQHKKMEHTDRTKHWENIYQTKQLKDVSWFQPTPTTSLDFFKELAVPVTAKIIDIGGGDSFLVDSLLNLGYQDITVLDISAAAIDKAKQRLGERSKNIKWIVSDIVLFKPTEKYDCWHDRAAFHFLTQEDEILKYLKIAQETINANGFLIIGTFSEEGPKKCSGIDIKQYSEATMSKRLENYFEKIKCVDVDHLTPMDTTQSFVFCSFRKIKKD